MGTLEGVVVLYKLISIPADIKNVMFLGFSLQRLLLLGGVFILFSLFSLSLLWISISDAMMKKAVSFVDEIFNVSSRRYILYFFSLTMLFFCAVLLLMPLEGSSGYIAYLERLAPLVYWIGCIGAQTLICQFVWRNQKLNWHILIERKKIFNVVGLALGILLVFFAWINWSGIGLTPEKFGWHYPGAPIIFSQLFLAWLIGLPFIIWSNAIEIWAASFWKRLPFRIHLDTIICLVLWVAAFLIWWGEPMRKESYFTSSPTPPNFEYYAYSDAALYDQPAQIMLIGDIKNNKTILHPFYVVFLVFLHMLGGQHYDNVIFFQILFLAVMPVLSYLLASMIGGRPAGVLMAILTILREKNAIALTNVIEISHSKLIMTDMPMTVLMVLTVYILFKWLKKPANDNYLGVFAGASYGLAMLVRSHQVQLIIPALLIGMAFSGGFQLKRTVMRILAFALGLVIVVTPWVWRNYTVAGKLEIESSKSFISWYAGAYTEPTDSVDVLPGESPADYSKRIRYQVFKYVVNHPAELARVYASYYIRNEIDSVMYLPMSLKLYGLRSYISNMQFWSDPLISFTMSSGFALVITLGFIVLGINFTVQKLGFLGLLPLFIHFTYNLGTTVARISGWRFVQPVDWILQLYYCIGLVVLTVIMISLLSRKLSMIINNLEREEESGSNLPIGTKTQQLLLVFFLVLGMSLPLLELSIPERYPANTTDRTITQYTANGFSLDSGDPISALDIKSFLDSEAGAIALYGRAIYPRYYEAGKYWGDKDSYPLSVRNIDRLQFILIGAKRGGLVFIPMINPPEYFPHASDVLVIGCVTKDGIQALAVKVNDSSAFVAASPWHGLTCSVQ
jgi:hypothetical protein